MPGRLLRHSSFQVPVNWQISNELPFFISTKRIKLLDLFYLENYNSIGQTLRLISVYLKAEVNKRSSLFKKMFLDSVDVIECEF